MLYTILERFIYLPMTLSCSDILHKTVTKLSYTRSSADADNRLDAFVGKSRSTNILGEIGSIPSKIIKNNSE